VDTVLQALLAPRRREILGLLRRRERSAGEIHRALGGLTFGAVSQHLGLLEQSGLVRARREGRSRIYAARPEALAPLREWLDLLWQEGLAQLQRLAEAEERAARPPRLRGLKGGRRPVARRRRRRAS
jgi:DNA-binding transcriptional ArsR family regulator